MSVETLDVVSLDDLDELLDEFDPQLKAEIERKKAVSVRVERQAFTEFFAMMGNGEKYEDVAKTLGISEDEVYAIARKFRRKGFRCFPVPKGGDSIGSPNFGEIQGELDDLLDSLPSA